MCRHFIVVDRAEVARIAAEIARDLEARAGGLDAADPIESFRTHLSEPVPDFPGARRDAFPSTVVPLVARTGHGTQLAIADMSWGYSVPWKQGPVFNTRIETALGNPSCLWAESCARRRCVITAWSFSESHGSETVPSPRTGRPVKRQYSFARLDGSPLLLAGIHDRGAVSLVTTEPNGAVAPVHNRMPLALDVGEAAAWLAGDFEGLVDRSALALACEPER